MIDDVKGEVRRLLHAGHDASVVRASLHQQGFPQDAVEEEVSGFSHGNEPIHKRNSLIFGIRDVFDRIGYGASAPQFVNILLWLVWQSSPHILFFVGMLNGTKTLLSIVWSNILQEYNRLHQFSSRVISYTGILYGFSFLIMAAAMLMRSLWLFGFGFIVGTVGIVAYGDLYQRFVHDILRREHMSSFLRWMAHWGVLVTAASLLLSGFLLDAYPETGTPLVLFGRELTGYGFLFIFEITAIAFILSGYLTSFITSEKERRSFRFRTFLTDYTKILRGQVGILFSNKYVLLLTIASVLSGLFQIVITSYAGIAMYQVFSEVYETPFFTLSVVYAIAIIASFTGPYFTQRSNRVIGVTPTLSFGTVLMAILPVALVYHPGVLTLTIALSLNVIGGAITGFGQGMLARKLLSDETRPLYFRVQSAAILPPYLLGIPVLSWLANAQSLEIVFSIVSLGLVFVVAPLYVLLVLLSHHERL